MGTTTKMESRPSKKHFKKKTDYSEAENETYSSKKSRAQLPDEPKKKEFRREKGYKDMPDLIDTSSRKTPRVIERNSPDITKDEMHSKRRHSGILENSNKKTLHQKKGFQEKYDVVGSVPRRSNKGNQRDSPDISNKRRDDNFPVDDGVNGKKRQAGLRDNSDKEIPRQNKGFQGKTSGVGQKKGFKEKSDDAVDSPNRKKNRVMRIESHDISNKRIDDGVSVDGKKLEKKVDTEANNEVSMNAQFRAIQPRPSILSFVEDNLLGRRRLIELRRAGYNIEFSAPLDNVLFSTSSERE